MTQCIGQLRDGRGGVGAEVAQCLGLLLLLQHVAAA
jgi:hypothetical protein